MASPRSISVLMPIYNGELFLPRVLEALAGQKIDIPWDFTAVNCSSTDSTPEIFERFAETFPVPLRVVTIDQEEFDHGDTRNLLAALSTGELLVFITDDAIPASGDWLATVAANFEDPRVGGVYCRNIDRPEASTLAKILSLDNMTYAPGRREVRLPPPEELELLDPFQRRNLYNYCDTASAMRRSLWERHPYPRCEGAEDVLMAKALLHGEYTVVYDDQAAVQHTHEYDVAQITKRALFDGEVNAEWFDRVCILTEPDIEEMLQTLRPIDRQALKDEGLEGDELDATLRRAGELRRAHFQGLYDGGLSRVRRLESWMRESGHFTALFLVDGDPLVCEDGIERYAVKLARRLEERGHRCVLAGIEAGDGPASLRREERGGLTTYRITGDDPGGDGGARLFRSPTEAYEELVAGEGIEVIHAFDPKVLDTLVLESVEQSLRPVVLNAEETDSTSRWPEWFEVSHLVVCATRSLRKQLLEETEVDRSLLVHSPPSFQPDEETDHDLLRWEYRYRALICIDRDRSVLLDVSGQETVERFGDILEQGLDTLFLSGDGAAVEYELAAGFGDEWEITLHIPCFRSESRLLFGGLILVDGEELARFGPFNGCGIDELRCVRRRLRFHGGARRLRIENRLEGGEASNLRLRRVEVRRVGDRRRAPGEILFDRPGIESDSTAGTVTVQGVDSPLLSPGVAALEYELEGVSAGSREIEVHVTVEAAETQLALGGRILVDGLPLGRFGPFFSRGKDEVWVVRVATVFREAPHRLRLENVLRDPRHPVALRVKHVVVRSAPVPSATARLVRRVVLRLRALLNRPMKLNSGDSR